MRPSSALQLHSTNLILVHPIEKIWASAELSTTCQLSMAKTPTHSHTLLESHHFDMDLEPGCIVLASNEPTTHTRQL